MSRHFVIRADASTQMGTGHVMRCLSLARGLVRSGHRVTFVCCPVGEGLRGVILGCGIAYEEIPDSDWSNPGVFLDVYGRVGGQVACVDHYGLAFDWEKEVRMRACFLFAIDDLADRKHCCDMLLDQTWGRLPEDYLQGGLIAAGCRLLLGSDFALLRPEFGNLREVSLGRRVALEKVERILISFGGSDPHDLTSLGLEALEKAGYRGVVDVVRGACSSSNSSSDGQKWPFQVIWHQNTPHMAELMAAADLALGAGGTSTWERCCLGLPSLLLVDAANQEFVARAMKSTGAARVLEAAQMDCESLARAVKGMLEDHMALREMAAEAAKVCDGKGVERVIDCLGGLVRGVFEEETS